VVVQDVLDSGGGSGVQVSMSEFIILCELDDYGSGADVIFQDVGIK